MTIETRDAPTTAQEPSPGSPRPRRWGRLLGSAYWILALGLIGLNAWWAWEARPLPDLKTISGWMNEERFEEATQALRAHLRRSPHDGEARMMLASVLAVQKDLSGSAEQLHNVPFWWPEKPLAQYREGVAAMAAGRAKAAEAAWKACVANDPLHPTPPQVFTDSVKGLVGLYKLEERKEEARALLWWAYEQTAPDGHPQILIMLVWMELRRSELTASIDTLRRFVAATPDDWEARRALASAEMELGREAEAKREIQACLKARPGDLRVWRDWLALLGKQGDRDALLAAVGQLPKAADGDPECWKFRGLAREKMGDFKGATEAYRRAIKLRPDDETGLFRLAIVEQRLGERDRADAHRKRSQELREAHQQLRKAYDDYLDCTASSSVDGKALTDAISRLASNCEVLGLTRDAEAWRRLLPRDFTAEGAGKAEKPKN